MVSSRSGYPTSSHLAALHGVVDVLVPQPYDLAATAESDLLVAWRSGGWEWRYGGVGINEL